MLPGTLASAFLLHVSRAWPSFTRSLPGYGLVTSWLQAGRSSPSLPPEMQEKREKKASADKDVEAFPGILSQLSSYIMAD